MFKRIIIVLVAALAVLGCEAQTNTKYVDRTHTIALDGAPTSVNFTAYVYDAGVDIKTGTPIGGGVGGRVAQTGIMAVIPIQPYSNRSFDAPTYQIVIGAGSGAGGILKYKDSVSLSGSSSNLKWLDMTEITAAASGISLLNGSEPIGNHVFKSADKGYTESPAALSVSVQNTGATETGELRVTISDDEAFTVSPSTIATIQASETGAFTISPRTGLDVGAYGALVTVGNTANGVMASFSVIFTVNDSATPSYGIMLSEVADYAFPSAFEGEEPPSRTVKIFNTGNRTIEDLTVTLDGADKGSFAVTKPKPSIIDAGDTATFTVTPNDLAEGAYTATVTVSGSSGETAVSAEFDVSFTVKSGGDYGISLNVSGTLYFSPVFKEETVTITNTGAKSTGPLTVKLGGTDMDKFTLSTTTTPATSGATIPISSILTTGNANATFTIKPVADGLAPDTYTATVTVSAATGNTTGIEPKSFDVSFTVGPVEYGIRLSFDYPYPEDEDEDEEDEEGIFRFKTKVLGEVPAAEKFIIYNIGTKSTGKLEVSLTQQTPLPAGTTAAFNFVVQRSPNEYINKDDISPTATDNAYFEIRPVLGLPKGIHKAKVTVSPATVDGQTKPIIPKYFIVSFEVIDQYPRLVFDGSDDYKFRTAYTETLDTQSYPVTVINTGNVTIPSLTVKLESVVGTASTVFEIRKSETDTESNGGSITITSGLAPTTSATFFVKTKTNISVADAKDYTARVTVSGGSATPVSLDVSYKVNAPFTAVSGENSALAYLTNDLLPGEGANKDNPALLKMGAIPAGQTQTVFNTILNGLGTGTGQVNKYVDLDLSLCGYTPNTLFDLNVTDPTANSGKANIVSLILPNAANGSVDGAGGSGTNNSAYAALKTVSGANITSIADNAFRNCSALEKVNFPNAITIGISAFKDCKGLTDVFVYEATSIGQSAFSGCTALTTASFLKVTSIAEEAFAYSNALPLTITMGNSNPTQLGKNIFLSPQVTGSAKKSVIIKVPTNSRNDTNYGTAWLTAFKGMGSDNTGAENPINVTFEYY
jgi:hypothetical protein